MLLGSFTLFKKRQTREFRYSPLYYKPDQDPEEMAKERIGSGLSGIQVVESREERFRRLAQDRWKRKNEAENALKARRRIISLAFIVVVIVVAILLA